MQENPNFISESPSSSAKAPVSWPKSHGFLLSLIALALVVGFTIVMSVMRLVTESQTASVQASTEKTQESIDMLRADTSVVIASLIAEQELTPSIHLQKLVSDFVNAAATSGVHFQGFTVKGDMISTTVVAHGSAGADAALAIIKMMKTYTHTGNSGIFTLEPVLSISGTPENRMTAVTFKIIPAKNDVAPSETPQE